MTEIAINFNKSGRGMRMIGSSLSPFAFTLRAEVVPVVEDPSPEAIVNAIRKWHIFIDDIIADGIFFSTDNVMASRLYGEEEEDEPIDNFPILIPMEPTDDAIAIILKAKLDTLSGDELSIRDLTFREDSGVGISYTITGDLSDILPTMADWMGDNYFSHPWWFRDDPTTVDLHYGPGEKPPYAEEWELEEEPKPSSVIRPEFRPTVIDGKKND